MYNKIKALLFILVIVFNQSLKSQPGIRGQIIIDSTLWAPVVYLSYITDFDKMYTLKYEMILDTAHINKNGGFSFSTDYLPEGDNLLRVHICKKKSPPVSLIIGGDEENYLFIIVNKKFHTIILDTSKTGIFKNVRFEGYYPNRMLQQIDEIASYLDSTSFNEPQIKNELIHNAIFEKLRNFADTCSNPVVSLYALNKSNFEKNYPVNQVFYKKFLSKWRRERSTYFNAFRKKIPILERHGIWLNILVAGIFLVLGFVLSWAYFKFYRKTHNLLGKLSIQERKVFALLMQGKSNKEISEILNIGLSTVKSHVNSIYSKLEINSRKEVLNLSTQI